MASKVQGPVRVLITGKNGFVFHGRATSKKGKAPEEWKGCTIQFTLTEFIFPPGLEENEKRNMPPEKNQIVFAAGLEKQNDGTFAAKRVAFRESQVR